MAPHATRMQPTAHWMQRNGFNGATARAASPSSALRAPSPRFAGRRHWRSRTDSRARSQCALSRLPERVAEGRVRASADGPSSALRAPSNRFAGRRHWRSRTDSRARSQCALCRLPERVAEGRVRASADGPHPHFAHLLRFAGRRHWRSRTDSRAQSVCPLPLAGEGGRRPGEGLSRRPSSALRYWRRPFKIFTNERLRSSSIVRPVASASSSDRAPLFMPRMK
jgi:hypothetical protein